MSFDADTKKIQESQALLSTMMEAIQVVCPLLGIALEDLKPADTTRFVRSGMRPVNGMVHVLSYEHEKGILALFEITWNDKHIAFSFDATRTGDTIVVYCESVAVYPTREHDAIESVKFMLSNLALGAGRRW